MAEERKVHKLTNYLFYCFVYITAVPIGLIWLRPKIRYTSKAAKKHVKGGAICVSNHVGFLDPVYIMFTIWYRIHHFVCLDVFFKGRFRGWLFSQFHCIPIDRDNFSMHSLNRIKRELDEEHLVSMFPEGHISSDGGLAPFKSGAVFLALRSGKPIVPVYIKKPKHWYSRLKACVGEQFDVKAYIGDAPNMSRIQEALKELERRENELISYIDK